MRRTKCRRWLQESNTPETRSLVRRAMRTLTPPRKSYHHLQWSDVASAETALCILLRRSVLIVGDSFCRLPTVCPVENAEHSRIGRKAKNSRFHLSGHSGSCCDKPRPVMRRPLVFRSPETQFSSQNSRLAEGTDSPLNESATVAFATCRLGHPVASRFNEALPELRSSGRTRQQKFLNRALNRSAGFGSTCRMDH